MNAGQRILVFAIQVYRLALSPAKIFLFGPSARCRYTPSCSAYALDAIKTHGAARGAWLALCRICRCHPWGGCGHDPVPLVSKPLLSRADAAVAAGLAICDSAQRGEAATGVAQVSNLLYRGFPIRSPGAGRTVCQLEVGDTAQSSGAAIKSELAAKRHKTPSAATPPPKERGQLCPREGDDGEETRGQGCPRSGKILALRS